MSGATMLLRGATPSQKGAHVEATISARRRSPIERARRQSITPPSRDCSPTSMPPSAKGAPYGTDFRRTRRPTTCGTGSRCPGIAVFDHLGLRLKTGIRLAPACVRPQSHRSTCTHTLQPMLWRPAASTCSACPGNNFIHGPDLTPRAKGRATPEARPIEQGRNHWKRSGSAGGAGASPAAVPSRRLRYPPTPTLRERSLTPPPWLVSLGNWRELPPALSYAVAASEGLSLRRAIRTRSTLPHGISVVVKGRGVPA